MLVLADDIYRKISMLLILDKDRFAISPISIGYSQLYSRVNSNKKSNQGCEMEIAVYLKPSCVQCNAMCRVLEKEESSIELSTSSRMNKPVATSRS